MTRTRRSIMTFATGSVLSLVRALLAVTAMKYVFDWLGEERFGAFQASLDWFGYAGLLEFGISGAITPLFVRALANDDRAYVVQIARVGLQAYVPVSYLMALAYVALAVTLPWVVDLPQEWHHEIWIGGAVFAAGAFLTPMLTFKVYLEASQRGALLNVLLFCQLVSITLLGLLAAGLDTGLIGQFVAFAVASAILPLSLGWIGFRRYPELLHQSHGSHDAIPLDDVRKEVKALSWPTFLFNVCSRIAFLTDNLVVAAFLGPAKAATFFLTQRVVNLAGSQTHGIASATWSGLIDLYLRGDVPSYHRKMLQTVRVAMLVGVGILVPVAVFNRAMISAWIGSQAYAGETVTWLAAVNTIMLGLFSIFGWSLNAAGKIRDILRWSVPTTLLNFAGTIAFTHQFGIAGPLWGTFVSFVVLQTPWTLLLMNRHFQLSPWTVARAVVPPALLGAVYALGLVAVRDFLPYGDTQTPSWISFAIAVAWTGLAVIGFLPIAWFLGLPREDRLEAQERIAKWLGRTPA